MREDKLKGLIEKYYNGESTLEEEKTLRNYFTNNDIPAGYEAEKEIFSYYTTSVEIPEASPDLEIRIIKGIDSVNKKEEYQKTRRHILSYMSIAAGLLILAGSYFFFINRSDSMDTFSDPEIAYAETVKILRDISSRMNHGIQTLEPVNKINEMTTKSFKDFNKSTEIIEKNLKNLNNLQKAIELTKMPVRGDNNK